MCSYYAPNDQDAVRPARTTSRRMIPLDGLPETFEKKNPGAIHQLTLGEGYPGTVKAPYDTRERIATPYCNFGSTGPL